MYKKNKTYNTNTETVTASVYERHGVARILINLLKKLTIKQAIGINKALGHVVVVSDTATSFTKDTTKKGFRMPFIYNI